MSEDKARPVLPLDDLVRAESERVTVDADRAQAAVRLVVVLGVSSATLFVIAYLTGGPLAAATTAVVGSMLLLRVVATSAPSEENTPAHALFRHIARDLHTALHSPRGAKLNRKRKPLVQFNRRDLAQLIRQHASRESWH